MCFIYLLIRDCNEENNRKTLDCDNGSQTKNMKRVDKEKDENKRCRREKSQTENSRKAFNFTQSNI